MKTENYYENIPLTDVLMSRPDAQCLINGTQQYPDIIGFARFYQTDIGVVVFSEIGGLEKAQAKCGERIYGFHIHEGESCTGSKQDPLANTLTHYDPHGCLHPYHSGDMPPLFSANGFALSVFLTDRFYTEEIIGKTMVLHSEPDDFTTQPSGNSGSKIACGVIEKV